MGRRNEQHSTINYFSSSLSTFEPFSCHYCQKCVFFFNNNLYVSMTASCGIPPRKVLLFGLISSGVNMLGLKSDPFFWIYSPIVFTIETLILSDFLSPQRWSKCVGETQQVGESAMFICVRPMVSL